MMKTDTIISRAVNTCNIHIKTAQIVANTCNILYKAEVVWGIKSQLNSTSFLLRLLPTIFALHTDTHNTIYLFPSTLPSLHSCSRNLKTNIKTCIPPLPNASRPMPRHPPIIIAQSSQPTAPVPHAKRSDPQMAK